MDVPPFVYPEFDPLGIERWQIRSADELLASLRLSAPWWQVDAEPDSHRGEWVFRGVSGDRPNLPRAWRSEHFPRNGADISPTMGLLVTRLCRRYLNGEAHANEVRVRQAFRQVAEEIEIVRRFGLAAESAGIALPWAPESEDRFLRNSFRVDEEHLRPMSMSWFAFAQHHGMPTRLLDVTYDPHVAAFAAAGGLADDKAGVTNDGAIVVWAFHVRQQCRQRLRIYHPPRFAGSYLERQSAAFLYDADPLPDYLRTGEWPTIDDVLRLGTRLEEDRRDEQNLGNCPGMLPRKFVLAACHRDDLLRLLDREEVNRSRYMPTLDNVAKDLQRSMGTHRISEYVVILEPSSDGSFSAYVPDLPDCVACGDTLAEIKAKIGEAARLRIESMRMRGETAPPPTSLAYRVAAS